MAALKPDFFSSEAFIKSKTSHQNHLILAALFLPAMSDSAEPHTATSDSTHPEPAPTPVTPPAAEAKALIDLSGLQMMPAWVASAGRKPAERTYRDEAAEDRPRRPGGGGYAREGRDSQRRTDQSFRPRRDGPPGGPGGSPPFRRDGPPSGRSAGPRPRRDGGPDSGPARSSRGGDGRGAPQREWIDLPKDIQAAIEPDEKAVEALAQHIRASGHAFSMFDAARLILSSQDRFRVRYLCASERPTPLYVNTSDPAIFLSREEAQQHLLRGSTLEKFYLVEEVELEAPKGDFKSIGICGLSGELLGPPSHHSFQSSLMRLHRERFSHLPLEEYKRRIRTETTPEIVAQWKEQQSKGLRWTWKESLPAQPAEPTPAEPVAEEATEVAAEDATNAEAETPAASAEETPAPPAEVEDTAIRFTSRAEVEAHFRRTYGENALRELREAYISGTVDKANLSPALFIMMRQSIDSARKHLFEVAQKLGSQFERRGLKLFKRRSGKLFVSRIKPKAIAPDMVFSERVTQIVEILKGKTGSSLHDLVEAISPTPVVESAAPAAPHQPNEDQISVIKDIRWLANEGYLIEYSDGMVFLGVQGEPAAAKPAKAEASDIEAAVDTAISSAAEEAPTEEAAPASEAAAEKVSDPTPASDDQAV
jgi:hypothetical protein